MSTSRFHGLIFILTLANSLKSVENRAPWKLSALKCFVVDKEFCDITICELKTVKSGITQLSAYVKLKKEAVINATIYFGLKKFDTSETLLASKSDGCAFLQNKKHKPMTNFFYSLVGLEKFSNINHTCPYNHDLILNKSEVNLDVLAKLNFPRGKYIAYSNWHCNGKERISFELLVEKQ